MGAPVQIEMPILMGPPRAAIKRDAAGVLHVVASGRAEDDPSRRGSDADPARDLRDLLALTEDDGPRHGLILPGVGLTPGAEG